MNVENICTCTLYIHVELILKKNNKFNMNVQINVHVHMLCCIFIGRLYAIGGFDGEERLSTVEVFHQGNKKWKKVASMNCKRR